MFRGLCHTIDSLLLETYQPVYPMMEVVTDEPLSDSDEEKSLESADSIHYGQTVFYRAGLTQGRRQEEVQQT